MQSMYSSANTPAVASPVRSFLTREECAELLQRATRFAVGGGETELVMESQWTSNLRWARNQIISSGDVRNDNGKIIRMPTVGYGWSYFNRTDDQGVETAVRMAERRAGVQIRPNRDTKGHGLPLIIQPHAKPLIFSETTYRLDAEARAHVQQELVKSSIAAGMLAAGYLQVSAQGRAVMDTESKMLYYPYTTAEYSVTVRDPQGTGSGWAGLDHHDWAKIDTAALTARALEKCLASRNPVAIEPGRYTTILEPQAVSTLVNEIMWEYMGLGWAFEEPLRTRIGNLGEQVIDERLTITSDPMDPELGSVPFGYDGMPYRPVTWIDQGILAAGKEWRDSMVAFLGKDDQVDHYGYRMSGGTASVDDMIAATKRGILVTRFSNVELIDPQSMLMTGYTRDGLWLVENGKISKPIKNFRWTESPMFVLNQVEMLGVPMRVYHAEWPIPQWPVIVPAMKVRDFSFTALTDAV